jgi:hypothetical protein
LLLLLLLLTHLSGFLSDTILNHDSNCAAEATADAGTVSQTGPSHS